MILVSYNIDIMRIEGTHTLYYYLQYFMESSPSFRDVIKLSELQQVY